jgi:hypothetical protein
MISKRVIATPVFIFRAFDHLFLIGSFVVFLSSARAGGLVEGQGSTTGKRKPWRRYMEEEE